ncbi:OxaA [Desulforapulum autotrophicum HRM2]|uniref:Membrane protein insertase YidC n=1 Tax=Desulforapulum autotrophicum (strain ATCC 43914 / DSM 3382 / VKM B-1955 / HRM2) TaxID=177437 RepID=C0QIZ1_DESAH|nr:membrane protein insertase YidC [Desulforapulum autotrophicum]ACN13781.1 OxaA [Desulforapulum autotrophicum HRM2]
MDDQKRLFTAIILSIVVIVGWNFFFVDSKPVPEKPDQAIVSNEQPMAGKGDIAPITDPAPSQQTEIDAAQPPATAIPTRNARTIQVSNQFYNIAISETGAKVNSLTLNAYRETSEKDSPLKEMVSPNLTGGLFGVSLDGKSIPGLETALFTAQTPSDQLNLDQGKKSLTFTWTSAQGVVVEKIFTFSADSYLIGFDLVLKNSSGMPMKDSFMVEIPGIIDEKNARFSFEGPTTLINDKLEEIKAKKIAEKDTYEGQIQWAGYTDRYFMSCLIPQAPTEAKVKLSFDSPVVTTRYVQSMERLDPGKQVTYSFSLFMGPKSLKLLSSYGNNLKKAINFGWFDILAKPCLMGMNLIHGLIPNYGIAIMLLTLLIKLIFWPLGTKSYRSMNDMKKLQPLMMEMREKYKGDKQRMNQEVMGLYKTYKVNPMSGCLPMIVQMPIFFALYRMLYQAIELRHAPFMWWINDLSAPDRLFHFDFAIPFMQAPYGIPVLTIIMGATMFLQQKMSPSTGDPTQAKMMMLMPLFMTFIFINFPAGLVLYWLVNNVLSIGQQYYIQKKFA